MKQAKRFFCATLAAALLLLTACGAPAASTSAPAGSSASAAPSTSGTNPADGMTGELSIYLWDNEYAAQAAVEAYQVKNPNVKIDLNLTPFLDYQSKLYTSLAGGEKMDVYFIRENTVFETYVAKGLCAPLDDYIADASFDMAPYDYCNAQYSVDGKVYAVPYRGGGYHLYYNKALFDAANVPYPDINKSYTWEEFSEVAKKLTSGEGADKVYGLYMMGWPWMQMFQGMQEGAKIVDSDYKVDLDSEPVRRALEWYNNTCVVDKSQMTPAEATATNASITPVFVGGKAAMILAGDYMPGNIKKNIADGSMTFDWGMARCPVNEGVEYATQSIITKACINPNAKNPELAADFLMFLASEEGQSAVASTGSKPAMSNDKIRQIWSEGVGIFTEEQTDLYFENTKIFSEPLNLAAPVADTVLTEELSLYMTDKGQTLDQTIANAVKRLEEEIAKLDIS